MRRLTTTASLVVVVLLAGSAQAAAAGHAKLAPLAVVAPLVVSPQGDAVVGAARVRVVLHRYRGARTRVRLGTRDVTARFRASGARLVGWLARRDGLRSGRNDLLVVVRRPRKAELIEVRSFFIVRRQNNFVRVIVRRGQVLRVRIDTTRARPTVAEQRIPQAVVVRLNGRPVSNAATVDGARRDLALSATYGLRFGVNRLTVYVAEPQRGRYAFISRRIVVARSAPLPAAGVDEVAQPGVRVRLGGRATAAHGGRLTYRWTLISRPRGSKARLLGAMTDRPLLDPDRPGEYVARQVVTEHSRARGLAARVQRTSSDEVLVTAEPQQALFALATNAFPDPNARGITIGGTFYPYSGPTARLQWLMLDRATLTPTKLGNTWCCDDGEHSLASLSAAIAGAGLDQLVIITIPRTRDTLADDQLDEFNTALDDIGVAPLTLDELDHSGAQLTFVGVPHAAKGSGWMIRRATSNKSFQAQGWLMPDGDRTSDNGIRMRFQPLRPQLTTRQPTSNSTNTMNIAGVLVRSLSFYSPSNGNPTGGFHVVEVDPRDMSVVGNPRGNIFFTAESTMALENMAALITGARNRGDYVAVQSVGDPIGAGQKPTNSYWLDLSYALAAMGANPDLFLRLQGGTPGISYAFFGGPPLTRAEVAQSSSNVVLDPTHSPPVFQTGTLDTHATMLPDGFFVAGSSAAEGAAGTLDDAILRPPTPWKYSPQDPNVTDPIGYANALNYITSCLPSLRKWAPNVRAAYLGAPDFDFTDSRATLDDMVYPGDPPKNPSAPPCAAPVTWGAFSRQEFNDYKVELLSEFRMIIDTRTFIGVFKDAFGRAADKDKGNLSALAKKIHDDVEPPAGSPEIVSSTLYLEQSIAEVGEVFEVFDPAVPAAIGLAADLFDLGTAIASEDGQPIGQTIDAKAADLGDDVQANVASVMDTLDEIRATAISDPGRLQALADIYYANESITATDLSNELTVAAQGFFATELIPVAFKIWQLNATYGTPIAPNNDPTPANCSSQGGLYEWLHAPDDAWLRFYRTPFVHDRVLVRTVQYGSNIYPPESVTMPMFTPVNQNGYGINKSTFFWDQGGAPSRNYDCYSVGE